MCRNTTIIVLAILLVSATALHAAPIVTMAEINGVVRTLPQGGGTYKVLDFYLTNSAGADFTNFRIIVNASAGSLFDPARSQDDRQQDDAAGEANTAGSVDTYVNTVMSAAAKEDGGYLASITVNPGSYSPSGPGAAPAFTVLDWSVFDTVTGDDNNLNDFPVSGGGPFLVTAPYRIARILATNVTGAGFVQVQAFDTQSAGIPTVFQFAYGVTGVPGDYNNNATVDAADYVLWRKGGPLMNEVDTPGTVNAADYSAWRARFGNRAGSGGGADTSANAAVPEPSTVTLLFLATVSTCARPKRKTWSDFHRA